MKRPLVAAAVVLALGLLLFYRPDPPALRAQMEEYGTDYRVGTVTGTVIGSDIDGDGSVLTVQASSGCGKVRVYTEDNTPRIGARIKAEGSFFLYPDAENPGQFDVRSYYDHLGIYLGFTAESVQVLEEGSFPVRNLPVRLKRVMKTAIEKYADPDNAGIYEYLLLGIGDDMETETENTFEAAGMLRLIRLSGFQLAMIGSFFYEFLRKITGKAGFSAGLSGCLMLFAVAVSGFTGTSVRALILFFLRAASPLVKRKFDILSAGALAVILVLVRTPGLIFTSGMQYYLAALFSTGVTIPLIRSVLKKTEPFFMTVIISFSIASALLPVQLYGSYTVSPYAPAVSMLTLPFAGMLTAAGYAGTFSGMLGLSLYADAAFYLGDGIVLFYRKTAEIVTEKLPFGVLVNGEPSAGRIILYLLVFILNTGAYYALFRIRRITPEEKERRITRRTRGCAAAAAVFLYLFGCLILKADALPKNLLRLTILDVGQGDGCLIETGGRVIMVDGGSTSEDELGENILLPALHCRGYDTVDLWIISHPDLDHYSGMEELLNTDSITVKKILISDAAASDEEYSMILLLAAGKGIPVERCAAGDSFSAGATDFLILSPEAGSEVTGNDMSLVFRIDHGDFSALFTGDITEAQEKALVNSEGKNLDTDLLKVPHHGSKYSSSAVFLSAVSPEMSAVSYGKYNSYGHPADETLERLKESGSACWLTGKQGAYEITYSAK